MFNTRKFIQLICLLSILVFVFVFKANVELWCPFGGVESLYSYFSEGNMVCALGSSNLLMLVGILIITLFFKRVFCSFICPLGTISELLHKTGSKLHFPQISISEKWDKFLSLLKYVSLFFILLLTIKTGELIFRGFDPCYALISRHGKDITIVAYIVSGVFVLTSLLIKIPFCRWLCPFAAVLNIFSKPGLLKIKINHEQCISCGKCDKACLMKIAVSKHKQINHARCTNCLECVDACPITINRPIALTMGKRQNRFNYKFTMISLLFCGIGLIFLAGCFLELPSFTAKKGTLDSINIVILDLKIKNVTCNGSAKSLKDFLFRQDDSMIKSPLVLEIMTSANWADIKIKYNPARTTPDALKNAILEPRFDPTSNCWLDSPFQIKGYDILDNI